MGDVAAEWKTREQVEADCKARAARGQPPRRVAQQ